MSELHNLTTLAKEQYRDSSKLQDRIDLHERFSTNDYGWFEWVFDQFDLPARCQVLELGCGPGDLWSRNRYRVPAGWSVTLSDFSPGMTSQAWQNLGAGDSRFRLLVADAQFIPFAPGSFDAVLANHMLYHVPDRTQALAQIRRVLMPLGCLYATTIGTSHMRELRDLLSRFDPGLVSGESDPAGGFTLENGGDQLARWFPEVSRRRYEDSLRITEAKPLVDYVLSSSWLGVTASKRDAFARFVEKELDRSNGTIRIGKDSGIFMAHLDR